MELLSGTQKEEILNDVIKDILVPHFLAKGMNATGNWVEKVEAVVDVIRGPKYTEQLVWGRSPGKYAPIEPPVARAEPGRAELPGGQATLQRQALRHLPFCLPYTGQLQPRQPLLPTQPGETHPVPRQEGDQPNDNQTHHAGALLTNSSTFPVTAATPGASTPPRHPPAWADRFRCQ